MANLYEVPNITNGFDDAIVGTVAQVNPFTSFFLLFVYGFVLLSGIASQRKRIGSADIPLWSTIASVSTLMVTLPLTRIGGLIDLTSLVIVAVVTIGSGLWLFLDRNKNEV